jgi:branched-chain amino acid transport system substrate-binding protein
MLIQGKGMEEASRMAMEEINDAGGVLGRKIVLVFGDEGTDPATGTAEMERIISVEGVDFVVGGFRTEILFPAREVAMDHKKILIITGAATNELLNCFGSLTPGYFPCGKCLYDNYDRYKYMFRVMPPNSTMLFLRTLIPYMKNYLVPNVLGGTTDSKVKVAAVVEDLTWADVVAHVWEDLFPVVFGSAMNPVYFARPSNTETDFSGILTAIKDSGAKLILHVFSGEAGMAYIRQWAEMKIPAVTIGVNVLSQNSEMWPDTEGKCEYEAFLSSPPRVPMTPGLIPWWDRYVERWGHDPLYTSLGTYDAVNTLKFGIERAGTLDSDAVVAALEGSERDTLMGRGAFTQYHDVFIKDQYPMTEHPDWVAPLIVQWRSPGRRAVIFPFNRTYSEDYVLPPWVTP